MRWIRGVVVVVVGVGAAGCGAGDRASGVGWRAVTDTVGDTVVVRTVAGSVWGGPATLVEEMRIGVLEGAEEYMLGDVAGFAVAPDGSVYVYDRQVPVLRKYSPDGTYVATFGREGGGPGEYRNSDGGLAVLPDGRVVLRDPGNARMQLYSPDGEPAGSWPIQGGWFVSQRVVVDAAGHIVNWTPLAREASPDERRQGVVRYAPDGTPVDTVFAPDDPYEAPYLRAERTDGEGRSVAVRPVPFSATEGWTFSALGYAVGWVATRYAIDLFRPEGVLRIGREYEPVPVLPDEREDQEERTGTIMRRLDPGWKWNGPAIPDMKPPFQQVYVGGDGRLWVLLHTGAEAVEVEEEPAAGGPGRLPPQRWREPVVFDVFEPDGRYLGQVRAPEGFARYPEPYFRGDGVWAIVRGELDVQYLTRFRVERASG